MQVIITRTEMDQSRQFNRKLAALLKGLPGTEEARAKLIKQSCEPIDLDAIEAALDPSQIRVTMDDDENLVVWINSDAIASGMDLMLDQYGIIIEIGVALYPIARLAKRLFKEFGEKMVNFGERFARKPDAKLGAKTMLYTMNGEPIWQEARIEGASFDGKQLLVWTESSDGPVWHLASRGETYAHVLKTAEAKFMTGAVDEFGIAGRGWEFTAPDKSE
jgi:hypothetical protein